MTRLSLGMLPGRLQSGARPKTNAAGAISNATEPRRGGLCQRDLAGRKAANVDAVSLSEGDAMVDDDEAPVDGHAWPMTSETGGRRFVIMRSAPRLPRSEWPGLACMEKATAIGRRGVVAFSRD